VPGTAAATATCAANPICLVAGAAAVSLPATAATPQNRRPCAAFSRAFGAGERGAGKGAYLTAARAPAPTDAMVQPPEVAAKRVTARCATATGAACRGAGCRAARAAPLSAAATPLSPFPASDG